MKRLDVDEKWNIMSRDCKLALDIIRISLVFNYKYLLQSETYLKTKKEALFSRDSCEVYSIRTAVPRAR